MDFESAVPPQAWSNVLNKIDIQVKDPALHETFYTGVSAPVVAPRCSTTWTAVIGLDHHRAEPDNFQNYSTFSLWDTFHKHAMLTMRADPTRGRLHRQYVAHYRSSSESAQQKSRSLPIW